TCVVAAARTRQRRWALAAGVLLGLMQATKATAPVFAFAALGAWALTRPRSRPDMQTGTLPERQDAGARDAGQRGGRWHLLAIGGVGFAVRFVVFYSSFFSHFSGLRDALATYATMGDRVSAQTGGHEKAWWYYGDLFWWHRRGGYVWD